MKTTKKIYNCPEISKIELDNEISLVLNSFGNPQNDPNDWSKTPDYFNADRLSVT
jgi:hypothetical protein